MSTRVRLAVLAAVLGLSVSGLAACSDDPPSGSPPPSSTSSSPTSPSPSGPPTLPAEAKGRSPEAAEAFVRYYVDLINYGLETLDSAPLLRASTGACRLCAAFARALDTLNEREGRYEGGRWSIKGLRRIDSAETAYVFEATVRIGKERIVQLKPKGDTTHPARTTAYVFRVEHRSASPKVVDLQGIVE